MAITDGPIKIFIGCAPDGLDAESQMVTEYTLKNSTDKELEIHWMILSHDPKSFWYCGEDGGWVTKTWATPFSGFRWGIPAACDFKGQAIYMDSDMIALHDINDLWEQPWEDGKVIQAKGGQEGWRYCVAKWHCERAETVLLPIERIKTIPESHQRLMGMFTQNQTIVQPFKNNWNCIDGEDYKDLSDPDIKIIHYSDMSSQPHLKYAVPRLESNGQQHWYDGTIRDHWRQDLKDLFEIKYKEALDSGYTVEQYVPPKTDWFGAINKESQSGYRANHSWEPANH